VSNVACGARENVIFLGPPGAGKTHLAIGLAIRACQAGHRVLFATAAQWVARLAEAHHAGARPGCPDDHRGGADRPGRVPEVGNLAGGVYAAAGGLGVSGQH
jgi:hypothetical protein